MAFAHQLDGTEIEYIEIANWQEDKLDLKLDQKTVVNRFKSLVWEASIMIVEEFNFLTSKEGKIVTLITTDYDSRNNDFRTYYGVKFQKLSASEQPHVHMVGVRCEFRVPVL